MKDQITLKLWARDHVGLTLEATGVMEKSRWAEEACTQVLS